MCQPLIRASSARASSRIPHVLGALVAALVFAGSAAGQFRPLVIQNATVLTGDGRAIENASILITGGKITGLGPKVEAPFLARKIDAKGKFVTPGLIDLHTTFGTTLDAGVGGGIATARAADAFDRFANDDLRAALRQGVTTAYVPARSQNGVGGLGAIISLAPGADPNESIMQREAALNATIDGSNKQGPLQRVKSLTELRKLLRGAKEYRENWEDYFDDLKEYEEKLAKQPKDDKADAAKGAAKPAAEKGRDEKKDEKKDDKDKKDEKKDELKKPLQPPNDRNAAAVLKALDGDLVLRVEAHAPADIVAAIELLREYGIAAVLEGGSGAHLLADRLAAERIPVILSAPPETIVYAAGPTEYRSSVAAQVLARAGVDVYFGTGVVASGQTPRLALVAARAVGQGFDANAALAAITSRAADLLGLEDLGRVAPGKQADLVIWTGHPMAADARVERVLVKGQEVYVADGEEGE